jgi:hypothetical protein
LRKKFLDQGESISFFLALSRDSQLKELYKILIPEMRDKLYRLCSEKGAALYAVLYYLHDIKIIWENEELMLNQTVNFTEIDDIRKWYKKTKVKKVRLLENIEGQQKIIDEIKNKAEELRKFILDTFDIDELISYSSK